MLKPRNLRGYLLWVLACLAILAIAAGKPLLAVWFACLVFSVAIALGDRVLKLWKDAEALSPLCLCLFGYSMAPFFSIHDRIEHFCERGTDEWVEPSEADQDRAFYLRFRAVGVWFVAFVVNLWLAVLLLF